MSLKCFGGSLPHASFSAGLLLLAEAFDPFGLGASVLIIIDGNTLCLDSVVISALLEVLHLFGEDTKGQIKTVPV